MEKRRFKKKLESTRRYLGLLEPLRKMDFSVIKADPILLGACERYLYLAAQATIDLAEMAVREEELGILDSMAEAFRKLRAAGILAEEELTNRLIAMVGFRNALSHGYEDLNYTIVENVLQQSLVDLDEFARIIEERYCV